MHKLALKGKTCKKRRPYSSYRGEAGKIAANLLARGFTAEGPDRKFVTDVTEFKLPDGKLYLSPVMDLYSRRIVGYSISPRPDFAQIRERMEDAFGGREGKVRGALFHSDQGWQYQRKEFGGHPGGIRDGPVDVAEGQLPRQLGHGELLRTAESRDVLRRGGTLQRLRKPEEGPRGLHRMVQLKPAERVPPLEVASGGSFQFRYSLITYP